MTFRFTAAEPLCRALRENRDLFIGQQIRQFYHCGNPTDAPVVFVLDRFSVIVTFLWASDLAVDLVPNEAVQQDPSLNFLFRDLPESRNVCFALRPFPAFFVGRTIAGITVERFSHAFEGYEAHPAGGDYFSGIRVQLREGGSFAICPEDPLFDGYFSVVESPEIP